MKWLKRFNEAEIANGVVRHFGRIGPEISQIFEPEVRPEFKCNDCGIFFIKRDDLEVCPICHSQMTTLIP